MNILKIIGKTIAVILASFTFLWIINILDIMVVNSNMYYTLIFIILSIILIVYCVKRVKLMPTWERKLLEILKVLAVIFALLIITNILSIYFVIDMFK